MSKWYLRCLTDRNAICLEFIKYRYGAVAEKLLGLEVVNFEKVGFVMVARRLRNKFCGAYFFWKDLWLGD